MTDEHDDENKKEDAESGSDKKESGRSARAARREALKKDEEPSTEEPKKEEAKKEEPKKAEAKKEEPRPVAKSYAVEKPAEACCGGGSISLSSAVMMMVFFFGLGLVLGGFFLKLGGKTGEKSARTGGGAPPQATQARLKMEIPADAPGFGPADAPVTIVVFDDFQCPWCEKASKVIDRVLKEHPADVRFAMVNFPLPQLHKEAELAAQAGMEAHAQGKFKQMHDIMFANQRGINRAALDKWAQQIGLDVARFKAALDQNTHQAAVQRHMSMGKSLGVRGTPTMLINGRRFNMTRDMDQNYKVLNALILEEMETVKKQNIPRGQAWQKLTATGMATLEQLTGGPAARPTAEAAPAKGPQAAARREVDPNVSYKMEIEATDTWKGDPKALVTIVEFSEYQCPHCKNADGIVDEILAAYPQGVKFVFMNNPIRRHPHAHPAAVAALEVNAQKGLAAFWAFHKKLFENQKDINPENIQKWVQEAGLDMAKYKAAVDNKTHDATIARQQALAMRFGARGTPAFFVNGYFLSGARPLAQFKPIIDREIAKANQAISEGKATAENYYQFLMTTAEPAAKWIGGDASKPNRRSARPRLDHTKVYRVFPEGGAAVFNKIPYFGDPKGQVVVTMGIDLECPWCEKLLPTLEELMNGTPLPAGQAPAADHFGGYKTGVKFVLMHYPLPFHKAAPMAHQAAQEVFEQKGPVAFYNFMKKCFQNQKQLTRPNLETWAQELGVNMPKFKEALDKETHKAFIEQIQMLARTIGVQGTPAVYVNGKFLLGRGMPIFRRAIDEALTAAAEMMKANPAITSDKVYEEIMKTAEPKAIWIAPPDADGAGAPVQIQKINVPGTPGAPVGPMPPSPGLVPPTAPQIGPRMMPVRPQPGLPPMAPAPAPAPANP